MGNEDKKKIEEAQEEIYEDRFLFNGENIQFDNGDEEEMYYSGQIKEAIKLGVNWALEQFLKNLWHPASEEPKLGKRVLVKINGNLSLFNSGFVVEHIRNFDDCYGIESWLYIDDLLPKEGGKE